MLIRNWLEKNYEFIFVSFDEKHFIVIATISKCSNIAKLYKN